MPKHNHHRRIKQRPLRPKHTISKPAADQRGQIDTATIRPHDTACHRFIYTQTTLGQRIVQINHQNRLHAVVRKSLPQLQMKQAAQIVLDAQKIVFVP